MEFSPNSPADQPRKRIGRLRFWIFLSLINLPLLAVLGFFGERTRQRAKRAHWAMATLPQLSTLSITDSLIREDLQALAQANKADPSFDLWTGDHVLLMTNGMYLLYKFRHGDNMGFVPHLFLAHGSDGRWYYSSYHFCSLMATVRGDDAPGSIEEFAQRYGVNTFDGTSRVCLRVTWPKN